MVSVCIGEYSSWHGLNGDVVLHFDRYPQLFDGPLVPFHALVCHSVQIAVASEAFRNLPQLYCLI